MPGLPSSEVVSMTNQRTQYTQAFREQALEKVYTRGSQSVASVAEELNMNHWTLKNWMTAEKNQHRDSHKSDLRPQDWSQAQRLDALIKTDAMKDAERSAFCRENGLFAHHLKQWRKDFETGNSTKDNTSQIRDLKAANKSLERELNRKEKALAEAAALLVLQKKYQALWEDKGE
jgi:transposase-like protein